MKPTTIRSLAAALFLAGAAGAPIASAQTISVSDAVATEGNSPGVTTMTFNVTMSAPAAGVVRVKYLTGGGTATTAFSTSAQTGGGGVTIPDIGTGTPYPSTLAVAGLTGRIKTMTVTLVGLTHTFSDDLDILLVGPGGQTVMLMSDVGGSNNPGGDYTFSDLAVAQISDVTVGTTADPLPPGTYRPSDVTAEVMAGPAPGGTYGNLLSVFNGTDPNGTWNLFIADDAAGDLGALASWRLDITTATGDYAGQEGAVEFPISQTAKTITIPVFGDATVESSETFNVTLSDLEGAGITIADGTGVGTINDNDGPSRVFVSITGNDANDCSLITTPCLTLGASLTKVTTDGEVIFLTGGEYDAAPILITKGVKVNAPTGVVAFIRQPITVNAPAAKVVLRGLTLKGGGSGNGVTLTSADGLYIENSTLDRWGNGLRILNAQASRVFVTGSVFRFNSLGIFDQSAFVGNLIGIEGSRFEANGVALEVFTGDYSVRETTFASQTNRAVSVGPGSVSLQSSDLTGNVTAVQTFGGGLVRLDRSLIHGNTTGVNNGAIVETLGTNVIRGNTTNTAGGAMTAVTGG